MKVVVSLGGSIIAPNTLDLDFISKFSKLANKLAKKHELAIVTGGGRTARNYIEPAREFGASEIFCDLIGIDATRLNARLLSAAIGDKANLEPPKDFIGAVKAQNFGKIIVMGGTHPGQSTDAVAALLSEYIKADLLINATDVDGIYNKDPREFKNAKMLNRMTVEQLVEMVKSQSLGAGKYKLMDLLAAKVIQRSRIRCVFVNGRNLENLEALIEGRKFVGTVIENGE